MAARRTCVRTGEGEPLPQVSLSQLETRVYTRLDGNNQLYPITDVDRLINEGVRILNLFTGFNQGTVPLGLTVANWQWYRVPAPVVIPMRVYLEGRQLYKSTATGTSNTDQRWLRAGAGSYTRTWIPVGTTMFGIHPVDPSGGKFLEVWGILTPSLLVNPGDTMTLDDEYSDLISLYAFMGLVLKEGGKPFADASGEYQKWMKRARALQRWEKIVNPKYWIETVSKTETPVPA
jgi:hypothetical protein